MDFWGAVLAWSVLILWNFALALWGHDAFRERNCHACAKRHRFAQDRDGWPICQEPKDS